MHLFCIFSWIEMDAYIQNEQVKVYAGYKKNFKK